MTVNSDVVDAAAFVSADAAVFYWQLLFLGFIPSCCGKRWNLKTQKLATSETSKLSMRNSFT